MRTASIVTISILLSASPGAGQRIAQVTPAGPVVGQIEGQSKKRAEHKRLAVSRDEVPDVVLRDAIGIATIWCMNEGMVASGLTPKQEEWVADAKQREATLDRYELLDGAFRKIAPIALSQVSPLSDFRLEGVIRRFPATQHRGDYVEMIYDVKKNLRCWVRLTSKNSPGCRVDFLSLSRDGRISMEVDLNSLLTGQSQRLYKSPSRSAPSTDLPGEFIPPEFKDGVLVVLSAIRNGFGLLTVKDCEGKMETSLGWVPIRDGQGRLIIWECDGCGGCC